MIQLRPGSERGHANHGWLDSYHTFSFADYYDPAHMGFGSLRVINEDRVQAGAGFGQHSHRDMEIISYVLTGALAHKDSLGNGSVIRPGDVQRMSAGTGVRHSEHNPSTDKIVHFLQIWILPAQTGLPPSYEQRHFDAAALRNQWRLIASPDARDQSVTVHQDALVYAAKLAGARELRHRLVTGRIAYLHVARGAVELNGHPLIAGDGAGITQESELRVTASTDAELLLFDLA
jgi:quercetin 2,3-dioxygenase